MRTRAQDVDQGGVDTAYLSTTYDFPEPDLQTLLDAPTQALVKTLLESLVTKGQEFDTLKSEKLRVDVELENVVRTSESKVKAQKAAVAKHVKEIGELRKTLGDADTARETLSSQVEQLRQSTSGSTAETTALRNRVETLETSNRDALALVESKASEKDRLATELSEQHGKLLVLRREISQVEEQNSSLQNTVSSQKFKEQSLQQEIDLLKRNNDWNANELQTRSQEHAKFRKDRNARIASLQRELEDSTVSVEALKRTEANLRQRLDDVQAKADEAFTRLAHAEEEMARKEQGWKMELSSGKRLAELQAQNAATHKSRLQEVQAQVDQIKEDAADEIGRLQAEIETERADKEQAEFRVADLELKVERLEQPPTSIPGTPQNGALGFAMSGAAGSPLVPGSARKFERMTQTQYVSRINELENALAVERRRTAKISEDVDEMIADVENRGPELQELRAERQRLEEELLNSSSLLDEAAAARERSSKLAQRWSGEAEMRAREIEILRQQLRDLSAQVKILLVELQSRDRGLGEMSAQERLQLEQAARGEIDAWSENETFTNQIISQRLVLFRDVEQLQSQNQKLLEMVRVLGDKMEGEEARKQAAKSEANAQEVEELRSLVARYKDECSATATQIDSYAKERDMFRRMLRQRGQLHPDADLQTAFDRSIAPSTPQRNAGDAVAQTPRSKDIDDLHKLLREQQTFFDQYRNESSTDRKMLKDQVDAIIQEKIALQSDLAHWKSQKTLADERLQMLRGNYDGLRSENNELQKRSQQMAENAAKQDLRTQQVAEELVEARSMAESLRNDTANGKAEKELWKRIEARLTQENKELMDERSRLSKMVTDAQNLLNEKELSGSEVRRRLQNRIDGLEMELAEAKKKVEQELGDARKASLRREYEENQSRTRIDDLVKSLGNVREELVAAKTTRDQLQARVDEMRIDLRSADEKVAALQPRPTPLAQSQQNGDQQHGEEDQLPPEQRLALQVSELRRDLELAKNELEAARAQVEQYKSIAQSTEEELASFNETSDQYKEEADRLIAQKESRAQELQQRVDDLLSELSTSNNELSELRAKVEDFSRALNEQKAASDAELSLLKDDAERHAEEKKLYQEDLQAQAEIAQQAQQSYENELVKHAEAAKGLQNIRTEYHQLRTAVASIRAEAEAAKASLERGEESWAEQNERLERELEEVRRRRHDVDEQNKLLHQQMESFSSELAALRTGRTAVPAGGDGERDSPAVGDGNLQEVIKYLRREKEIVDVQYELSVQEARRLQQQLDYVTSQLEESHQKLADERKKASEQDASGASTTKLMQTLDELNLFRESSTTLRNESRQAREKLEEKSKEIEVLLAELEPLKARAGELEAELESKAGEIQLLTNDRDRWRERTQNIICKYDRVDPAELEELRGRLEALTAEKDRLEAEQAPLREQVQGIESTIATRVEESKVALTERLDRFKDQAKEQNRKQNAKIKEGVDALETANADRAKVAEELEGAKNDLAQAKTQLEEANTKIGTLSAGQGEEGEVSEGPHDADLHSRIAAAEAEAAEHSKRADDLATEVQTLKVRVNDLEGQISTLQAQLDEALQDGGEDGEVRSSNADVQTLERLKQELVAAQQEVVSLRDNFTAHTQEPTQPMEGRKSVAEQVAEEVAKHTALLQDQHQVVLKAVEEDRDRRIENMKTALRNKLKEEKDKTMELVTKHSEELQGLREAHDATVSRLKEEHQLHLEKLRADGGNAVAKAEADEVRADHAPSTEQLEGALVNATEEQVLLLIKSHGRTKTIFLNNVNKRKDAAVAEKDQEIARLKEDLAEAEARTSTAKATEKAPQEMSVQLDEAKKEVEELKQKLAVAEQERQNAISQATDKASKKAAVQATMLSNLQAKISIVRKAAEETPARIVQEVWAIADKTKSVPARSMSSTGAGAIGSPGPLPTSPSVAKPSDAASPAADTTRTSEQDKIQQRQARFGIPSGPSTLTSAPVASTPTTFGQPSHTGVLGLPARRMSVSISTFHAPGANLPQPLPVGSGHTSLRGSADAGRGGRSGGIPRAGGATGRAAYAGAQPSGRGGAAVGSAIPRGGRGGGHQRGGGNAGIKRSHEGGPDGGDGKRPRAGGSSTGP